MDETDANGNWVVNAVAPNKWFLENISEDRVCTLTDLNGLTRQARGYAGFAFNAITSTADSEILRPVEDIFDANTRGALPPGPDSLAWPSILDHCLQIIDPTGQPAIAPFIHSVSDLKKGLITLGHMTRCVTPADEFSACGHFQGSLCAAYSVHGPIKLGYLYGFAGDSTYHNLNHDMVLVSQGGCKFSFQGTDQVAALMPQSPGFSQAGSYLPTDNLFSQSTPSESFIVLDGSRAVRIRLTSWFAAISDAAYQNTFGLLDTYINADCYQFVDNPYRYGGSASAPDWHSGVQWYTVNQQGQIVWGNTLEHIGGHSYWVTKKWFKELNPNLSFTNLHVLIKVWYCLPAISVDPDVYPADPIPDPWASEYIASDYVANGTSQRGSRPPNEVIWMKMHEVTTCHSTGDPTFNVDPEYTTNQGYTFSLSQTVNNVAFIHYAYYYNGTLVGQKFQQNIQPRSGYYPNDILANAFVNDGCGSNSGPYPSSANCNMYPFGPAGANKFKPFHPTIMNRSGLTVTYRVVSPFAFGPYTIDYGDGSQAGQFNAGVEATHTYAAAGLYKVTITIGETNTSTYFTVSS